MNKQAELGLIMGTRRIRKAVFLDETELVVTWCELIALIAATSPMSSSGRPQFARETMLGIHFLQQWFNLSDPARKEALFDMALFRKYVSLDTGEDNLPDESTILRFRHLLETHSLSLQILASVHAKLVAKGLLLKSGTVVDAKLIAAPSSTKNSSGAHDPEMQQTKKGNQWHFGMNAHIGVDADSGQVHTMVGTAAYVKDVTKALVLVYGEETDDFADLGYRFVGKRDETLVIAVNLHVAMRPSGKRKVLDKSSPMDAAKDKLEQAKACIRAKVEHPVRVIKRRFGHVKVRDRGLSKNTAQLLTLFALSNLWMARRTLLQEVQE